jgi:transcriptional regulator with XRE-family HTH domain
MNEISIGQNIRRLRKTSDQTLTAVALAADVSKSTLSKIEMGQVSTPVSTLIRVAGAIGVPLAEFFAEIDDDCTYEVTRKGKRQIVVRGQSEFGYSYEALAARKRRKTAEPFLVTIRPNDPIVEFTHEGEEFLYLLSGKLEYTIGGETFILKAGDSVYFDSKFAHFSKVLSKEPAKVLSIFMQPTPHRPPTIRERKK